MSKKRLTQIFVILGIGVALPIYGVGFVSAQDVTMVKDINLTPTSSSPEGMTIVGDLAFFIANDGIHGAELWCTDGTEEGTMLTKDIYPGEDSSSPDHMVEVNGLLFFTAHDGNMGRKLWKTDGTADGTVLIKDIYIGYVA